MADPFSVAAGAVEIISLATTAPVQLHQLISGFHDAPEELQSMCTALQNFRRPLNALLQLSSSDETSSTSTRHDLKQEKIIGASQVSCGVVFAQAESSRSGVDIGKILTTEKSRAFVGLPPRVVGKVNLRVGEVTTQGGSTSHVGLYPEDIKF
jgi:hypothetical protein